MAQGKGREAGALSNDELRWNDGEGELLKGLNESLHELSQPMTVLLCALEYGGGVGSMAEMKEMIRVSQKACERLREVSMGMRRQVSDAIEERAATRERQSSS